MNKFWTFLIAIITVLAVSLPSLSAEPITKGDSFTFGSSKHSKAKRFQYLLSGEASDKSVKHDKVQAEKIALDSIVASKQDGISPVPHYYMKVEFQFNANGLEVSQTEYSNEDKIGERVWDKEYRIEFKYDNKDRITEYLQYGKADDADEWLLSLKEITTYQSDTKATSQTHYFDTETGEWLEVETSELVFENGNIKEVTTRWDYGGGYVALERDVYEYNANGDILQWTNYVFDDETEEWTPDAKETYTYSGSNLVQYSYFYWDDMLDEGEWYEDDRTTYTYEGNVLIEFIEYEYDEELDDFAPDVKTVIATDMSVNPSDVIHGKILFEQMPIRHKVNLMTQYEYDADTWVKEADFHFYYSPFNPTSVLETVADATLLYPNPTSGTVHFAAGEDIIGSTIEIYDLAGRKLITQTLSGNASLSLGNLDAGMYIYKLTAAGSVKTGKIVKE